MAELLLQLLPAAEAEMAIKDLCLAAEVEIQNRAVLSEVLCVAAGEAAAPRASPLPKVPMELGDLIAGSLRSLFSTELPGLKANLGHHRG